MTQVLQYLLEGFFQTAKSNYGGSEEPTYDIYKNPNEAEFYEASGKYARGVRAVAYGNDLYMWNAMDAQHDDAMHFLKNHGVETYNSIPLWIFVDAEGIVEVRVGYSAVYTRFEMYIDRDKFHIGPKILSALKNCLYLKKTCDERTRWSTELGT